MKQFRARELAILSIRAVVLNPPKQPHREAALICERQRAVAVD
jgi:hypothetical protein